MREIIELFMNSYTFRVVALGCSLLGCISAIIGTFAVLKRESLLAHASLAGVCLAFILTGKKELTILLLGALFIGVLCIVLIHFIQLNSKVKFDSSIALMLSTFFGLGLVLLTYLKTVPGAKKAGLNRFIFGQASTLILRDIYFITSVGLILLILVLVFWKEIKISIFDKDYAKTLGINSDRIRLLVSIMIVVNVITGIQVAGVVLMTSMLVAPSVAARQWSNRLGVVVILGSIFGIISGFIGTSISTVNAELPTGPLIILSLSLFVLVSLLFSPRGIIKRYINIRKRNKEIMKKMEGEK